MAEVTLIFTDRKDGKVDIGMDIPDLDETTEMTNAIFQASLISYILEQGYHEKYRKEFIQEYERMIREDVQKELKDANKGS